MAARAAAAAAAFIGVGADAVDVRAEGVSTAAVAEAAVVTRTGAMGVDVVREGTGGADWQTNSTNSTKMSIEKKTEGTRTVFFALEIGGVT